MAHDLRAILRVAAGRAAQPTAAVLDARTLQGSIESGPRSGYDGHKRRKGAKVHLSDCAEVLWHSLGCDTWTS